MHYDQNPSVAISQFLNIAVKFAEKELTPPDK